MIRADRWVIAAVVFLGAGLWMLFNFCHGDAGLAFALPVSGSKVSLNVTTMGWPVLIGVPLTVIGALLMVGAFVVALVEQVTRRDRVVVSRNAGMGARRADAADPSGDVSDVPGTGRKS